MAPTGEKRPQTQSNKNIQKAPEKASSSKVPSIEVTAKISPIKVFCV